MRGFYIKIGRKEGELALDYVALTCYSIQNS